jgi:hypothetical protein
VHPCCRAVKAGRDREDRVENRYQLLVSALIEKRRFLNTRPSRQHHRRRRRNRPSDHQTSADDRRLISPLHNAGVTRKSPIKIVLRLRLCGNGACRRVFTICVSCDRGQRYCDASCRAKARREQRRNANRRYQQSDEGREAHRRCQRRYRDQRTPPVTDQAATPITDPTATITIPPCRCILCGQNSSWIDPFPAIPRHWRRAAVQNSAFFRER